MTERERVGKEIVEDRVPWDEIRCEILTDVEGVFTADPKIVPDARLIKEISYEEMLELASCGSKVIHPRAIELGWYYNIPIRVASAFTDGPGTLIHNIKEAEDG